MLPDAFLGAQCRELLFRENAAWVLTKLLSIPNAHPQTLALACRALRSFSFDGRGRVRLLEHGSLAAAGGLLAAGGVPTANARELAIAVYNLAACTRHHREVIRGGGIGLLKDLSEVDDPETVALAAGAICNMSCSPGARGPLIDAHAALVLVRLARSTESEVSRRAAIALTNMSAVPGYFQARADVRAWCICANPACAAQNVFIADGAVVSLLELAKTGNGFVRELCARTMCNLSFDERSRDAIVAAGVRAHKSCNVPAHDNTVLREEIVGPAGSGVPGTRSVIRCWDSRRGGVLQLVVGCALPDAHG